MHVAACKHMWHVFQTSRQNIVLSIRQLIFCDSCSVSVGVGTPLIARLPNFQLVKMPLDIKLHPGFQAFSFLCTFVLGSEKTIERTFAPVELSFHGTFAPWSFRSCGTFVPQERRFQELSFRGTFAPVELSFIGSERSKNFRSYETALS